MQFTVYKQNRKKLKFITFAKNALRQGKRRRPSRSNSVPSPTNYSHKYQLSTKSDNSSTVGFIATTTPSGATK